MASCATLLGAAATFSLLHQASSFTFLSPGAVLSPRDAFAGLACPSKYSSLSSLLSQGGRTARVSTGLTMLNSDLPGKGRASINSNRRLRLLPDNPLKLPQSWRGTLLEATLETTGSEPDAAYGKGSGPRCKGSCAACKCCPFAPKNASRSADPRLAPAVVDSHPVPDILRDDLIHAEKVCASDTLAEMDTRVERVATKLEHLRMLISRAREEDTGIIVE